MEKQFILQNEIEGMKIYTHGFPDYGGLSKAEKRALLLPLVEVIREFYKCPKNYQEFEDWKSQKYADKNAA